MKRFKNERLKAFIESKYSISNDELFKIDLILEKRNTPNIPFFEMVVYSDFDNKVIETAFIYSSTDDFCEDIELAVRVFPKLRIYDHMLVESALPKRPIAPPAIAFNTLCNISPDITPEVLDELGITMFAVEPGKLESTSRDESIGVTCPENEAQFWTVWGASHTGSKLWIADFPDSNMARIFRDILQAIPASKLYWSYLHLNTQ